MNSVNQASVRGALELIKDGGVFENFAKDFLSKRLLHDFVPVGGVHDRGLDGIERIYHAKGITKVVYQMSIQQTYKTKIKKTLEALTTNDISFDRFIYVTNLDLGDVEKLVEEIYEETGRLITVWDQKWRNGERRLSPVSPCRPFAVSPFRRFAVSRMAREAG